MEVRGGSPPAPWSPLSSRTFWSQNEASFLTARSMIASFAGSIVREKWFDENDVTLVRTRRACARAVEAAPG